MKLILYHGTSAINAKKIEKDGFIPNLHYNWRIKSKKGFVYLSSAYAPFYAMNTKTKKKDKLALVKCEVDTDDCYPEDDFMLYALKKPAYSQEDLDKVDLEYWKPMWEQSLKFMGNVAVKPEKVKILGITYFDGKDLIWKCDPSITPMNFQIMGDYYNALSQWIFDGKAIMEFQGFSDYLKELVGVIW
ncbi:MAG: hypothetical protein ACYCS1_05255 [Gammaproteobacteria bacterium]